MQIKIYTYSILDVTKKVNFNQHYLLACWHSFFLKKLLEYSLKKVKVRYVTGIPLFLSNPKFATVYPKGKSICLVLFCLFNSHRNQDRGSYSFFLLITTLQAWLEMWSNELPWNTLQKSTLLQEAHRITLAHLLAHSTRLMM